MKMCGIMLHELRAKRKTKIPSKPLPLVGFGVRTGSRDTTCAARVSKHQPFLTLACEVEVAGNKKCTCERIPHCISHLSRDERIHRRDLGVRNIVVMDIEELKCSIANGS